MAMNFWATALYPFEANNVDYSKCIERTPSYDKHVRQEEVKKHLEFLETKIDRKLLQEFRQTRQRNHDWEGDPHATLLFDVWHNISKESGLKQISCEETINENVEVDINLPGCST